MIFRLLLRFLLDSGRMARDSAVYRSRSGTNLRGAETGACKRTLNAAAQPTPKAGGGSDLLSVYFNKLAR